MFLARGSRRAGQCGARAVWVKVFAPLSSETITNPATDYWLDHRHYCRKQQSALWPWCQSQVVSFPSPRWISGKEALSSWFWRWGPCTRGLTTVVLHDANTNNVILTACYPLHTTFLLLAQVLNDKEWEHLSTIFPDSESMPKLIVVHSIPVVFISTLCPA